MKLYERWQAEYMQNRYLSHLTREQLTERARYLVENLTILCTNGKIGIRDASVDPGHHLMQSFTHVLQEFRVRSTGPLRDFMAESSVPNAMIERSVRLGELVRIAEKKKPQLVKFGKNRYLGRCSFKVSLASSFDDPSLGPAQRDDELRSLYTPNPNDVKVCTLDGAPIKGVQTIEFSHVSDRDFYVFCSSLAFDVRLFGDFGADSCLFIYDSKRFAEDLLAMVQNRVPLIDRGHQPVEYFDPIRPTNGRLPKIEFHKHIRFLYQNEFRHVYIPKPGEGSEQHLVFDLPSVGEYSEIYCL